MLDSAAATARAVVVLTDGIQNSSPDIPAATAAVAAKAAGSASSRSGSGSTSSRTVSCNCASVTNGVAQITGELAGDREFLLQKLYVQILSDVSDEAFVQDPTEVIYPGTQRATDVCIGEVDVAADFIVVYRKAAAYPYVELWLEAPDGTVIRPADAGHHVPELAARKRRRARLLPRPVPSVSGSSEGTRRALACMARMHGGQRALTHGYGTGAAGKLAVRLLRDGEGAKRSQAGWVSSRTHTCPVRRCC